MEVIFKSLLRKIAYIFAAVVIFSAVLVVIARFVTPLLNDHRADIEVRASAMLQMPVKIDQVQMSWYRYHPVVSLQQVTLLSKETNQPTLQIQKIDVRFSLFKSLWRWDAVPASVMISGSVLNVNETASGEYSIQGFPSIGGAGSEPFKSEQKLKDIANWISKQPNIVLNNIDIRYKGFNGQKRFVTLVGLSIDNDGDAHSILGKTILHQDIPTEVTLAIKWKGTEADIEKIKAKIYVYVSGLSLSQWLAGSSWKGWQIKQGMSSAKIWASFNHGTFQKIQTTFQLYGLGLYSDTDKSLHKIHRLSGNLGWKRDGAKQIIAGDDVLLDLSNHLWPVIDFHAELAPDASGALTPKLVKLGYADLRDLQEFLFSSPKEFLSNETRKLLTEFSPRGSLINTVINFPEPWSDWSKIGFETTFNHFGFDQRKQIPGLHNFSGFMKWNGMQGEVTFNTNNARFEYDAVFSNAVPLEQITGAVKLQHKVDATANGNQWIVGFDALHLMNTDLAANISGQFIIPEKGSVVSDLSANFTMQKAKNITRYLPMKAFDADLRDWLKQAFLSGEIQSANITLRGALDDYPFDKNNGIFSATGTINNVDLRYAPDWPLLQKTSGKLAFSGRRMDVDIERAQIFDMPVGKVHGEIPYLGADKPQFLTIQTEELETDFADAMQFVHSSPLEDKIGKMFKDAKMSGPIFLKLNLNVPLSNPDNTQVKGELRLKDASMFLTPWNLQLSYLNGVANFTEDTIDAKEINALIFNKPLTFSLNTTQKTKQLSVVRAALSTNLSVADVRDWLKLPDSKIISGATNLSGTIDFSLTAPIEMNLNSTLVGVSIDAEAPYAKKADEVRNVALKIIAEENKPLRAKLQYADLLSAAVQLTHKGEKFNLSSASLRIGSGTVDWAPTPGLYIYGDFDKLDWDKIKSYSQQSDAANPTGLVLRGIDINTKLLDLGGQHITNARLKVAPQKTSWNIDINSNEVVGNLQVPANLSSRGLVTAQFQRLRLKSSTDKTPTLDPRTLPAINFKTYYFSYNDIKLGQVAFKTTPTLGGVTIQSLQINSDSVDLRASGAWTRTGTRLQGEINSPTTSEFLNSLGFDVHNFVASKGNAKFSLAWQGAPYAPVISSMSGTLKLDVGKGSIVEVEQASGAKMGIGRMLSVFSLQNIPKRLMLNFSDMFEKGYGFDSLTGDFNLRGGNAFTNNMRFEGSVARIDIDGRIGFGSKDLDVNLSVTPYVTSSVPVAAALVTGPAGFVAGLAVNTVIGAVVSKAATYYYIVKGSWENPNWQTINASQRRR